MQQLIATPEPDGRYTIQLTDQPTSGASVKLSLFIHDDIHAALNATHGVLDPINNEVIALGDLCECRKLASDYNTEFGAGFELIRVHPHPSLSTEAHRPRLG